MTSGRADYIQEWLDAESSTPIALDEDFGFTAANIESDHDNHNQGLATRLYRLGRQGLQNLCRQKRNIPQLDSSQSALREELGKLYLWGEAFENGDLDKALEQSEDLRNTVLEFLCAIGDSIIRASQLYAPSIVESAASPEYLQDLRILVEDAKSFMPSNVDEALSEGSEDEGEYGVSKEEFFDEDNGIAGELQLHIGCLIDLGPTLEKCFLCTRNGRVRSSQLVPVPFYVSDVAGVYISLIRDKFRDAEARLIERLGEANWQRHVNVRLGMANVISDAEVGSIREEPCSTFGPYSAFHNSGIGPSVPTQTQYAASHTSFVSSVSEKEEKRLGVPREPVEVGAGRSFKCYLCGEVLSNIRNRLDWKFHVLADLRPYICTFADCDDKLAQFSSRAAWADHEFTKHRINRFWNCPECPEKSLTAASWTEHLEVVLQRAFCGPNLEVARDVAYNVESKPSEKEECPFCRVFLGRPRRAFVKHVGSHMEEIALMALPRDPLDDSEDKSVIKGEGSMETSRLVASSGFTLNNSLPRLSAMCSSSRPSLSVSDGLGERQINCALRIMVPDADGALVPTFRGADGALVPISRRTDQDAVLECPFIFLNCSRQFDVSNERDWIQHSLEHFRINEERPRRIDPPRSNVCCFCSETYEASSGISSWLALMDHIKVHQQHFGQRMATARHGFALVESLWQQGVLSLVDYRELKSKSKALKAPEGEQKSFSPRDPDSLVDVKVASKAPRDSERGAVHSRRK